MAFKRCASIILLQTQTPRCSDKVLDACVLQELLHAYLSNKIDQSMSSCFGKDKKIKNKNRPFIIALLMKNLKKNKHLAWPVRLFSRSRTPRYLRPQSLAGGSWTSSLTSLFPGPLLLKVKVFHDSFQDHPNCWKWKFFMTLLKTLFTERPSKQWSKQYIWNDSFKGHRWKWKLKRLSYLTLSKAII